jgi:hypothetical protein
MSALFNISNSYGRLSLGKRQNCSNTSSFYVKLDCIRYHPKVEQHGSCEKLLAVIPRQARIQSTNSSSSRRLLSFRLSNRGLTAVN